MQPAGRLVARLHAGGTLPARAVERKLVRAPAWGPAADLQSIARVAFIMAFTFEWDVRKAVGNERKHGVAFDETATCLR